MCTICRRFKKGTITAEEAREELEEQSDYLNEDHIEEVEDLINTEEDAYDYLFNRKDASYKELQEDDYDDEELPLLDEDYDLGGEDEE
jgi:hypothetical protein